MSLCLEFLEHCNEHDTAEKNKVKRKKKRAIINSLLEPRAPIGSDPSADPLTEIRSENTTQGGGRTLNSVTTDQHQSTTAVGLASGNIITTDTISTVASSKSQQHNIITGNLTKMVMFHGDKFMSL